MAEDASAITLSRAGPAPDGGLMRNSNPTLSRLAGRPLGTPSPSGSVHRSPAADTLQLARLTGRSDEQQNRADDEYGGYDCVSDVHGAPFSLGFHGTTLRLRSSGFLCRLPGPPTLRRQMRLYAKQALHDHELAPVVHLMLLDREQHVETGPAGRGRPGWHPERLRQELFRRRGQKTGPSGDSLTFIDPWLWLLLGVFVLYAPLSDLETERAWGGRTLETVTGRSTLADASRYLCRDDGRQLETCPPSGRSLGQGRGPGASAHHDEPGGFQPVPTQCAHRFQPAPLPGSTQLAR